MVKLSAKSKTIWAALFLLIFCAMGTDCPFLQNAQESLARDIANKALSEADNYQWDADVKAKTELLQKRLDSSASNPDLTKQIAEELNQAVRDAKNKGGNSENSGHERTWSRRKLGTGRPEEENLNSNQ